MKAMDEKNKVLWRTVFILRRVVVYGCSSYLIVMPQLRLPRGYTLCFMFAVATGLGFAEKKLGVEHNPSNLEKVVGAIMAAALVAKMFLPL